VSQNPKAIGYVGFGYLNPSVKALFVNNVEPTIANGKSGAFPISRKLYMYVNEKKLKEAAKNYIDCILGREGQELVKSAGFIPITDL
ncbi:MAG: phosphate ABC transporter substrate-binding protein, partial [Spirochaetes bacterium]|nr:phosphate ABC transporter substrate-binding protein [Spirochaetota bacterium]